jgi:signal transduction histidine kinase
MEMMLGDREADPELKETLAHAMDGTTSMNRMVRSILDVSRMESGTVDLKLGEIDIGALLEGARDSLGPAGARVTLETPETPGPLAVHGDPEILERTVVNLLRNALDYSPEDQPVAVSCSPVQDGIRISVRDRGPGIPEEFRERIFEKFGQVKGGRRIRKGSVGLGLAFCKLAVEAHGGRIGVESHEGAGSEFWFELPLELPSP